MHQVAVGAELVVRDGSALRSERAGDASRVGGLAHATPRSRRTSVGAGQTDQQVVFARQRVARPRKLLGGVAVRGRHWDERPQAVMASVEEGPAGTVGGSRACTRAARSGHGRPSASREARSMYANTCGRPRSHRASTAFASAAATDPRRVLEHVFDDVRFGQPLDQLRLL